MLSAEQLSALIGRIYDCAIDPARWPAAMEAICAATKMYQATLLTADLKTEEMRFLAEWNVEKRFQNLLLANFQGMAVDLYRQSLAADSDIDLPRTISRHPMGFELFKKTPMYVEWAKPQRVGDAANLLVLREAARIGVFAVTRLDTLGMLTDADLAALRLLAPHLRRAVTISNIMDLKAVEAQALVETLDAIAVGIVLVAREGRIVLANRYAEALLSVGEIIASSQGRLTAKRRNANAELQRAIAQAADEATIGAAGIGISLTSSPRVPVAAHVLPLQRRDFRRDLPRGAAVAVFIAGGGSRVPAQLDAVNASLGLTEAEGRLLQALVEGHTLAEAARALVISRTTAKTHLTHIFEKTGIKRQSDLIRLVASLTPPIAQRNRG